MRNQSRSPAISRVPLAEPLTATWPNGWLVSARLLAKSSEDGGGGADPAGVQPRMSMTRKSVADMSEAEPGPPGPKASPRVLSQSAKSNPSNRPLVLIGL